jgi:hypothetical protein
MRKKRKTRRKDRGWIIFPAPIFMDRFQILKGLPPLEKKPLPETSSETKENIKAEEDFWVNICQESPNRNKQIYPSLELDYNTWFA